MSELPKLPPLVESAPIQEPCAFVDGRCTVCGEPVSGMCNKPDDRIESATIQQAIQQVLCRHGRTTGGNDYIHCELCGLEWDYRKTSAAQTAVDALIQAVSDQARQQEPKALSRSDQPQQSISGPDQRGELQASLMQPEKLLAHVGCGSLDEHGACPLCDAIRSRLRGAEPDVVCQHGTAMDVHCCNCHSGFIFDINHQCPSLETAPSLTSDDWVEIIDGLSTNITESESSAFHWQGRERSGRYRREAERTKATLAKVQRLREIGSGIVSEGEASRDNEQERSAKEHSIELADQARQEIAAYQQEAESYMDRLNGLLTRAELAESQLKEARQEIETKGKAHNAELAAAPTIPDVAETATASGYAVKLSQENRIISEALSALLFHGGAHREQTPCPVCLWPLPVDIDHHICECCGIHHSYNDVGSYDWDGEFWARNHDRHTPKIIVSLYGRISRLERQLAAPSLTTEVLFTTAASPALKENSQVVSRLVEQEPGQERLRAATTRESSEPLTNASTTLPRTTCATCEYHMLSASHVCCDHPKILEGSGHTPIWHAMHILATEFGCVFHEVKR